MDTFSADNFTIFNAMPGAHALVLANVPIYTVIGATAEFADFAGAAQSEVMGSSLFKHFPDNPAAPNVSNDIRSSLEKCLQTKAKNELAVQRYDIGNSDGTFRTMYWTVVHTPILSANGEVSHIIHTAIDVTDQLHAGLKDEKIRTLAPAHNLFLQSNLIIHILKGNDLVIALANEPTLRLWGRDTSVVGRPLAQAVPELLTQDIGSHLKQVMRDRTSVKVFESPYTINRGGKLDTYYVNYIIQPYNDDEDEAGDAVVVMINDMTANYHSKKELAEKERNLQLAIEIAELGIFTVDLKSSTASYSPQIMKWFGVSKLNLPLSELLGKIHPADVQFVQDTLSTLSSGRRTKRHDITFRVVNSGGEVLHLRSVGQLQAEDGKGVTLSGIIQDISQNIESQAALEQSAQRLRTLIDSAPFPIGVYTGPEMRIEMVNQSILDTWGRDRSVIGQTYAETLPELAGQGPFEQLSRVFETGEPFHAHHQRIDLTKNIGGSETFYFNYSFTPLFDNNGKVYGVMNTAADVTDLVVAQNALKESERNFRTMILQAPVAMCLMRGPEFTVEIANATIRNLWGKSEEEVRFKPVFDILPETRSQGLQDYMERVYQHGETIAFNEFPIKLVRYGKSEELYLNLVCEPYRDGKGVVVGVLVVGIDVTEQVSARRRIEEIVRERTSELEQANESLQRSNAELEQFAYIASHDLQEPLRKINMFTGMLKNRLTDIDERSEKHMENIMLSVGRMTNLISDILRYSQLSRVQEPFQRTDLNEVFAEAIADFDLTIEQRNVDIECDDLPVIEAVPLQMVQLFHNLISNAIKYSREGIRPRIEIRVHDVSDEQKKSRALTGGDYIALTFSDNGIGFSDLYASKIFNIFQRLHGRGQYEGTGIGLAMCKKIAENHQGLIFADSKEGQGSEFVIIVPIRQDQ